MTENGKPPVTGSVREKMLIGETWCEARDGASIDVVDPCTELVIARAAAGGAAEIDLAVQAARRALEDPLWRQMKPAARARLLLALADLLERDAAELARLESRNMGMPLWLSTAGDLPASIDELRYVSGWCTRIHGETYSLSSPGDFHSYSLQEPVGVVGAIVPWNFPLLLAVVKVAPALAAGCTVVLKPAEETPLTALRLGELALEAGFPPGVLNVVTGLGESAGAALAAHPGVDKITFTGSTEVGRSIIGASRGNLKKVSLELGGKSPTLIFADAALEQAAEAAANSIFMNSGQICAAGSRLYVESAVYDSVLERILAIAARHQLGDWEDSRTTLGPLVSARHLQRVSGYVERAVRDGMRLLAGGRRLERRGWFFPPTVLESSRNDLAACQEEIFGPVLVVQRVDGETRMLELANDSSYGLSAAVWTGDLARAHRLARDIHSGSVWINTAGAGDPSLPYGGFKQSGWGRERGRDGFAAYLKTKTVACAL